MTTDELGRGMYHDISAVLDRTEQVRSCEGAVHYQRNVALVSDLRELFDVGNVGVRVAQGLNIQRLCVLVYGCFKGAFNVGVNELCSNSVQREGVRQQVVGSAVDGVGSHDILTLLCERLNGVGDRCGAGSSREGCNAALKRGNSLFENVLGGVRQSAVDVACVRKTEACGGVSGVLEYIGSCSVYRHCACVGSGVGLLLANVEL
ncbi:putative uncharacterized protein [Eubacterium sp. CAG:786]|nr:putative uncharacterized protein [Eubacterium sp. CAG:786]